MSLETFKRWALIFAFICFPNIVEIQLAEAQETRSGRKALIPDISLIGSMASAYFEDEPVGDQGENPGRTGFNFQGAELAIQSVIDPYVRGDIFILFKEDAVEVEDATITTLALPGGLQIRAGKMLARLGRQNTRHLEQLSFVDQSRVNRYFLSPEGFSELGVELSALLPMPWFSEFSFEFLQGENEDNFDGARKQDFAYLGAWKNAWDLTETVTLQSGLSGVVGFNKTAPGNLTEIYAADLYLRWRPSERRGLKWQTEYFVRRREEASGPTMEGGLYSELIYQFARRWETGVRYDLIGLPKEGFRERTASPVLTFLASEYFRVRTQYGLSKTDGGDYEQEAFLQLQFNMGPHGAHVF